jgi:hypothetical protein
LLGCVSDDEKIRLYLFVGLKIHFVQLKMSE